MNRLWARLTLSFVIVSLIGVGTVAWLANVAAGDQFRRYLNRQEMANRNGWVDALADFYAQNGSWEGVGAVFAGGASDPDTTRPGPGMGQGEGRRGMGWGGAAFMLADANGVIVYGTRAGATLTPAEQADAAPIQVNAAVVGYLVMTSPGRGILDQAQQAFLDELRANILLAALVAGGLAAALGLAVSRALTRPLAELTRGARAFAARNWAHRVRPNGPQEIAELAGAFNDMAESLQREETLRRDMVADIAHELRTPVAVIQGNLRAMLDGVYPLERSEIATIHDETLLLNRLIDDLRELALMEAGQLTLNMQTVDVAAGARAAVERFAPLADARGITLEAVSAASAVYARADPDRLAQILRNLLSNALRYTPAGGRVTLAVARTNERIEVSVSDTGPGMTAEEAARVFDRFYRGDRSRARESGGSGLGLAIARSLAQAMGGQTGVESAPGRGSRFWFTLPAVEKTEDEPFSPVTR
jgi:two-component system OmpR family sensor kinase/two-component system sensor histidine kinase BaeS